MYTDVRDFLNRSLTPHVHWHRVCREHLLNSELAMDPSSARRVSLRGASAKEDSRATLLEKVAEERAARMHAKKMASAALMIQRIWRGRRAVMIAANEAKSAWDGKLLQVEEPYCLLDAQSIADDILRPFIFFMRYLTCHTRFFLVKDLQRISVCFQILLQSISCPDKRNFCTLAVGTDEQEARWLYQVHRLLIFCSAILIRKFHRKDVATSLLCLAMRLMVTLTDANMWKGFEGRKEEASAVTLRLLRWLAEGNGGLYYAAHGYLLARYPISQTNEDKIEDAGMKENFIVTASVITMALRPLHAFEVGSVRYAQRLEESKEKAAAQICRHIFTVPCLIDRLPAGLLPAFQHPCALAPCLQACKDIVATSFEETSLQRNHEDLLYGNVPLQAWTLANVVSMVSTETGGFLRGLVHEQYVDAVCGLLQSSMPWIEAVRERKKSAGDSEDISSILDNDMRLSVHNELPLEAFLRLLKPLYQQWHLVQLLEKAIQTPGTSYVGERDGVALTKVARLYSCLLTAFSAFNPHGGALPILNVLAFTRTLIPQLWNWLRGCVKLRNPDKSGYDGGNRSQGMSRKGGQENPGGRTTASKWANSFLKMKIKNASSDLGAEDVCSPSDIAENPVDGLWHIKEMKLGPAGVPEEAVPVLTLFCIVYAHLLLILDDDEFYDKQVLFSLEEQRMISAMLNTMVYHGFLLNSKHQFSSLMDASCRCLRALYERDSRRSFCPSGLWLAPAMEMRPAIAAAARAHEVASASKPGESSQAPAIGSILTTIPHVMPFEERVHIFREFVRADKAIRKMGGEVLGPGPGSIEISVRRDRIVEDGLTQLSALGPRLKSGINVSFVNDYGLPEAGLDYGGLFKEFLTDLAKAAFDPGYGLFMQTATEEGLLFPHPAASSLSHGLRTMEFLGRIVGKALYEGILLEYSFSPVFISKLLGRYCSIDDLASLDHELHRNLMYLKNYDGDVSDLSLDFTVTEEIFGKRTAIELIPGGAKVSVTNANRLQYVYAMADYKLNRQSRPVVNAFIRGLTDLIAPSWLGLFNGREFNQLLSGEEHDFDVHDLRAYTRYTGGYTESSRPVKLFWEVLEGLDAKDRCALLKFVTSCSRAPLLGFKHLQPPFTIHKVTCDTPVWTFIAGQDVDRLPTASTCYNILKLPTYRRASTLREKLQYAIRSNAGFELS